MRNEGPLEEPVAPVRRISLRLGINIVFWSLQVFGKTEERFEVIARCAKFVNSSMMVSMIEFLESFVPTATVFELDIQMFGVEPEHRHDGQEFSGLSRFSLPLFRTDRFRPTLIDAVAETQSAFITELEDGFCKVLVNLDRNKVSSKSIFTGHGHFPSGRSPNRPARQAEESRQ
jgi:hypothetical protein